MTPAPREGRAWSEEHARAATHIADSAWQWSERATPQEIADTCEKIAKHAHLFVDTALLSEADAARAKAIEECAKVCRLRWMRHKSEAVRADREERPWNANDSRLVAGELEACEREIRALAAQDRAKETT